jgi:hypothetical protein
MSKKSGLYSVFARSGYRSRKENASKQKSRASVPIQSESIRLYSMIRKSGNRFSEKIMLPKR